MDTVVLVAIIGGIASVAVAATPTLLQAVIDGRRRRKGHTISSQPPIARDRVARFFSILATGLIIIVGILVGALTVQTVVSERSIVDAMERNELLSRLYDVRIIESSVNELRDMLKQERIWPGLRYRDCEDCPELVLIPAGAFEMGSPDTEDGRLRNEGPQRTVDVSRMFWTGVYEVTNKEWSACVQGGDCRAISENSSSHKESHPVTNVSWHDAREYIEWISRTTGKKYRLLSEAEWEYVARASTSSPYQFGEIISTDQANFGRASVNMADSDGAIPVGSFPANRFGLHDVHGNAAEWVRDCWFDNHVDAPLDGVPRESTVCQFRVIRGGSWQDDGLKVRLASRGRAAPSLPSVHIGFRVARDA